MTQSDDHRQRDTVKRVAIGGMLAAIAGYIAGLLTAPKSGKETRSDIKAVADHRLQETEKDLKRLTSELEKLINDAKSNGSKVSTRAQKELNDLLDKARDSKEKAREMLSAIHEGDAEDQDLKRAIKNANNALDHLRDYLKK